MISTGFELANLCVLVCIGGPLLLAAVWFIKRAKRKLKD